jgi:hypothetical protein
MDDMNWGNQAQHNSYRSYGPSDVTQPVPSMTGPVPPPGGHRHRALRWTAGLATAAVLAGGGAIAGIDLAGGGSPASGQGAVLSAALNGGNSPPPGASTSSGATSSGATSSGATSSGATSSGATSSGATSSGAVVVRARRVAAILRHLRGLHGEFTVRNGAGGFREIAFERGAIATVSGKTVTVRAADGTTWTWTFRSDTVVRKDRARSSASSLATGDPVFVGGPEQGTVRGARLIIVPEKPAAGQSGSQQGAAPGPSPSSS